MIKTTVHLPAEIRVRLDAEAVATGVSRAELIRRGIAMLLDASERPRLDGPLPVFNSGQSRSAEELNDAAYDHIKSR